MIEAIEDLKARLGQNGYLTDDNLAAALYLAENLEKPLLLEGPAGVGKTELAKAWSRLRKRRLIRLQCYEGLDESKALYEWNYQKQLLYIQIAALTEKGWETGRKQIFDQEFLLKRPLLAALTSPEPVVLLIDEIDKSDQEFESFLLEALSDWQVTIPELGTISAVTRPYVVLTSNSTRELSDALRRRCLHFTIDYPEFERELAIVELNVPDIDRKFASQLVEFVQTIRKQSLKKPPSVTETIDWVASMTLLGSELTADTVRATLSALLKYTKDRELVTDKLPFLLKP
ncbi:AAA domain (dynein-related subfamily) [Sporomusa ovata DSM 2662]|uniref:Carbon monoxide dehydrogenase D protein n=1 Tax=Sporomusa ovata TaxID=2378 RepID=A0A0U1KZ46_9FIRM|nr:MoxR family ATPase [Sporomusa ovata]EQB29122.1 MoxR-like ATPase [Sporomusa ovata DSM 2662]CQR72555.1 carbon monoxide dehydrogenase D protein [Sporomusa ovata]